MKKTEMWIFAACATVIALLGEVMSGYTTNLGVQTYFFENPIAAIGMTVLINGSIVLAAIFLKVMISGHAFRNAFRPMFLLILVPAFAASGLLSAVGAYKHYGFRESQGAAIVKVGIEDLKENAAALEDLRLADIKNIRGKIEPLKKEKFRSEAIASSSRGKERARNIAAGRVKEIGATIAGLTEIAGKLEQITIPQYRESVSASSDDSVRVFQEQLNELQKGRQQLINLHQALPQAIQDLASVPSTKQTTKRVVNEQSAFFQGLAEREPAALTALGFAFALDALALLWAFAGVEFPPISERIMRLRRWTRRLRRSLAVNQECTLIFRVALLGPRFAADFYLAGDEMVLEDLFDHRVLLERKITELAGPSDGPVRIDHFENADGERIEPRSSLMSQLPEHNKVITIVLENGGDTRNGPRREGRRTAEQADQEMPLGV